MHAPPIGVFTTDVKSTSSCSLLVFPQKKTSYICPPEYRWVRISEATFAEGKITGASGGARETKGAQWDPEREGG